jgi:hypothetical protein
MIFYSKKQTLVALYRQVTSCFRALPNFIVIGTMKSGTSSMYSYLKQHPQVNMAYAPEVHFFHKNFHKGVRWYRSFFPLKFRAKKAIGEVTPGYIFKDKVAEKAKVLLPRARFIVLLRSPVARLYSHFQQLERRQPSGLSFEDFILPALSGETSSHHEIASNALMKGLYGPQIAHWLDYFDKKQFIVLESERLFADPNAIMKQVHEFLELKPLPLKDVTPRKTGGYTTQMKLETRELLNDYYAKSNQQLGELGFNFSWI